MNENKMLCYFMQTAYAKMFDKEEKVGEYDSDLYPFDWTSMSYEVRCQILEEALEKKIKIFETKCYNENCEGSCLEAKQKLLFTAPKRK